MRPVRVAVFVAMLSIASGGQERSGNQEPAPAGQDRGTVCVLPNSPDRPTRISPGGDYNPATLTVSIDNGQPIPWPHKQPVKIENLTLNQRHLVVLTSDGKRIQSFWFKFSDYKDPELCLYFDGYQGVQLDDKHGPFWRKCR